MNTNLAAAEKPRSASDDFLPASTWVRAYQNLTGSACPFGTRKLIQLAMDAAFPADQRGPRREWGIERRHLPQLVEACNKRAPISQHAD